MVFVFGNWRIDTARREAHRAGQAVALPRRVFDLVVYLLQQRARAVGRDELVSAVWGRVDVADVQISQLIARARRLLGDDAQTQATIRTVSGFGYRWVMLVQELDGDEVAAETAEVPASVVVTESATAVEPVPARRADAGSEEETEAPREQREAQRSRRWLGLAFAGVALLVVVAAVRIADRRGAGSAPQARASNDAIAVLPLEVDAPADAGWMQLGLMDLVAGRLRAAGLAVPPSDSVLVALRAVAPDAGGERRAVSADAQRLNPILGTRRLVRGSVHRVANGWRVTLEAPDAQGLPHKVETEREDPIDAGRDASELLLAALGHAGDATAEDDTPDLLIQRSQAAILGGNFDTAQEILDAAGPAERAAPRVQMQLAQIDFYRGRLDASTARLDAVLANAPTAALRARALTSRGMLLMRRGDCVAAEQSFSTALATPSTADATALAGRGLARSCQLHHAGATDDLGLARLRLEAAGDRLGVARVDNYLAIADANRLRLEPALVRFEAALATYAAFGVADAQRAALSGLLDTHVLLLRWPDAQRDAERLAALRPRIADAAQIRILDSDRARVLIGLGRFREAAELLDALGTADDDPAATRYREAARAELAWRRSEPGLAREAAARALDHWPLRVDDLRRAAMTLLRQRAGGERVDTSAAAIEAAGAGGALLHLAAAEAATAAADVERHYRAALEQADALGVPAAIIEVTASYAGWLLGQQRPDEAAALSGRIASWSATDFDGALLRVALFHARGDADAWAAALTQARGLAGERTIPSALTRAPAAASVRNVTQ